MMQRLIRGMRRALGLHHPGRNLKVWPDDVFILSFPKSGNTWTRFLIANLVYPETPADFSNINRLTPDPEALSTREMARLRRSWKSHRMRSGLRTRYGAAPRMRCANWRSHRHISGL
jgi:hypothetical protein